MDNNLSAFYKEISEIKTLTKFNRVIRDKNLDVAPEDIPSTVIRIPEKAIAARTLALYDIEDLEKHLKGRWQHYWLSCCLSEKHNYIFSLLGSESIDAKYRVNREKDLKDIITKDEIWEYSTEEGKRYYISLCIDFFLKRYNWLDARRLWWNNPPRANMNAVKLFFPRLLGAILVGFVPIVTSKEIWEFAETNQSNLPYYSCAIFIASFFYLEYECYKTVRGTVTKKQWWLRIGPVLAFGLFYSFIFSHGFAIAGFMGNGYWCMNRVIFYAMFAFLIGILIQLLWEEKTVTEPL